MQNKSAPAAPEDTHGDGFYLPADKFFPSALPHALTYDDVTLATNYSEILPRNTTLDTALSDRLQLRTPIISADMDTVTESEMAIAMALNGGLGIIHYNMSLKRQVKEVARVKNHIHGLIQDPITVTPELKIGDVLEMIDRKSYGFRTFPVVDGGNRFLGLLRGRVVKPRYAEKVVREAMTPAEQVLSIDESEIESDPISKADAIFTENMGIHKLLVLNKSGQLRGLFTLTDVERIMEERGQRTKPARDSEFRLICAAAISPMRKKDGSLDRDKIAEHVSEMVEEGLDAIAVSTAHGHTQGVGESARLLRELFPQLTIIAGNVTSGEGVEYLADCGTDAIKVGQGPGSICTTRIVAGVGIPQLTALYVASRAAARKNVRIIADGGISKSGDIVKGLTLADAVICGGLLAGCRESPGSIMEIDGKFYKQYRGMGSLAAMKAGSAARYGHDKNSRETQKIAAEGVEALKEVSGSVHEIMGQLIGGVQSGMGYLGAQDLPALRSKARYIRVTPAGMRESAPHDIVEVKTAK